MSESASSLRYRPTKVEIHQTEKRALRPHEGMTSIEYFRSHPEQRKIVLAHPFVKEMRGEADSVFAHESSWALLRSAILAEPEGTYEQIFAALPRKEQRQQLYDQIDSSAEMTIRIQKYIESHLSYFENSSDEDTYTLLCRIAFESVREDEIQLKYALSQRRGFRLSIVNFLEERNRLLAYRLESSANPKMFAEKYLQKAFHGDVVVESLPIGFIIYLDEQDYARFESDTESPQSIVSSGVTLSSQSLPEALRGKFIVINKGGAVTGSTSSEELASTKRHEIRHMIFREFHAQQEFIRLHDIRKVLKECGGEKDFLRVSQSIYEDFVEKAKDEIIAYFSHGKFDESFFALRFHQYQWYIKEAEWALARREDVPHGTKRTILHSFMNDRERCFKTIKGIKLVAERMYQQRDNQGLQKLLVRFGFQKDTSAHRRDVAEALLRNTPGMKIYRLARYANLNADENGIDGLIKEAEDTVMRGISALHIPPVHYDRKWWDKASQARTQMKKELPIGSLPTLLKTVEAWGSRDWTSFWVEEAILLIKEYIRVHGITYADKQLILHTVTPFLMEIRRTKDEHFKEVIKFAKEVLQMVGKVVLLPE